MSSPQLPSRYRLRPPEPDEASEIHQLIATCDAALGVPPSVSEDLLREFWTRPRFVLADDAWIVEHEQTLVGYAQVWDMDATHLTAFALVHPDHMGLGIGGALAAIVEGRASEMATGSALLITAVNTQDEAAADLLAGRGYKWARRFWHMEVDLESALKPPPSPAGIELRRLDPDRDLPAAHEILEEAFVGDWEYSPTSFEEFLDRNVRGEDFDPGLWIVAVDAGEPVGITYGATHTDVGWVSELGVLPSHRGRGIATALLHESFAEFERRGLGRARLNVDSDNVTGAVRLYQRVGMRTVNSYDLWAHAIEGIQAG